MISVRAMASDGASTVEATASAIVLDSPPHLTALSPPTTVRLLPDGGIETSDPVAAGSGNALAMDVVDYDNDGAAR